MKLGLTKTAASIAAMYGSNVPKLFEMIEKTGSDECRQYELPITLWVELKYAVEYEMVVTPVDFFLRRTGALFFNINEVRQYKSQVIAYLADRFSWDEVQQKQYTIELDNALLEAAEPNDRE